MDKATNKLTIFFEKPFWIGIFERIENDSLSVAKVTFGAEPKDYEVYDFVLNHYYELRFSPSVSGAISEKPRNPKRVQRELKKQLSNIGIGTKSRDRANPFLPAAFLGADADDYTYEALKLFLMGAISRAFQPGCKFEIMLCLVGGQGAGKSTFFRLLAVRDEWFSDDLRKLDDDNVYRKLQGHWIIEMSEMMATANAKSIEEIKSFLSRQKEVYKIPYETHPADRPRQCVFGGTSNALDFLPLDRSGNRRFIPVMVYPEQAEVHILEDEAASRAYIEQMWAEAMEIYRSGRFKLAFSPAMQQYLKEHQRDFMPEDTKAGMIQAYLDKYTGSMVCSKQLYKEALNHAFDYPKQWEIREINEIMNQCITGWRYFPNPRMFSEYGRQKG